MRCNLPPVETLLRGISGWLCYSILFLVCSTSLTLAEVSGLDPSPNNPESVIRLLVEANANKDLATMKTYMDEGDYMVGYTIGGRKFTNWNDFAFAMQDEFDSVVRLELPITNLQVRQQGLVAWFSMELDYIREVATDQGINKTVIPLRETGVLEWKNGKWLLLHWHESLQYSSPTMSQQTILPTSKRQTFYSQASITAKPALNLSGFWDIQEEDKSYIASLDLKGNGTYTWKDGRLQTSEVKGRLWSGHWAQTGNDREGDFEVLLSEDFSSAEGVWWYTRVGDRNNIPPRMHGGTYVFKRLTPEEAKNAMDLAREKEAEPSIP